MSGHSKWSTIKRKKEKTDAQRAKVFTKVGREIAVAVREGGPDPANNGKLRDAIAKAKAANVPADNIERTIKKSAVDKAEYETIVYEGYSVGGIAVMVETLTDNRNRTASDIRYYFDKHKGNLGTSGCVSFMFTQKGSIVIELGDISQDTIMEDCFESGALDVEFDGEIAEITTASEDLRTLREYFEQKGYTFLSVENVFEASNYITIDDAEQLKLISLLFERFDDNEDVQNYWHNLANIEDLP
ncbi:MAG: YebC/PmpR family DNA-binding transcriptional regulator [Oscillospiraceae bacterium]|nr:YebC/PmpR family DNA-binding transcriptional regulator [Oscillospiraceae bacterium]